ncbi:MAG: nucleotide exchange factor GrpE [Acidimicrobiales bacterium]
MSENDQYPPRRPAGAGGGATPAGPGRPGVPPPAVDPDLAELDMLDAEPAPVTGGGQGPGAEDVAPAEDAAVARAELRDITAELGRERDEYLDALRRLQAEFDNYRKRIERNQREVVENAATALVKKLLPVLDTADLALAHGSGEDVKQVAGTLFDILSKEGLERIDPEGQRFNPEHHDAVAHEPVEGGEAPAQPEVSEVMRAGYSWRGRALRPAMVKVRG